jgi:hypothetical protein
MIVIIARYLGMCRPSRRHNYTCGGPLRCCRFIATGNTSGGTCDAPTACALETDGNYYCVENYIGQDLDYPTCTPDRTKQICAAPSNGGPRLLPRGLIAFAAANGLFYRLCP